MYSRAFRQLKVLDQDLIVFGKWQHIPCMAHLELCLFWLVLFVFKNAVSANRNVFIPLLLHPNLFLSFSRNRSLMHAHDHHMYSLGLRARTEALDLHYFMILLFWFFFYFFIFNPLRRRVLLAFIWCKEAARGQYNHVTIWEHLE